MTRGGNTRKTGARYELLAAVHLEKCGYHIIEKNYRCRIGEIDLVACDGAYLVFVEVKYRKNNKKGGAAAAGSPSEYGTSFGGAVPQVIKTSAEERPAEVGSVVLTMLSNNV